MRKLPVFVFALVLAVAAMGCDSEDDLTDAEILVGSWTVVEVADDEGDKTDVFQQGVEEFSASLRADGTYELTIDYVDPQRPTVPLQGTYDLDEGANSLELFASLPTGDVNLPFTYDIESENEVDLSISENFVQAVFGVDPETYDGTVVFTIQRV